MNPLRIDISLRLQQLYLFEETPDGDNLLAQYPVSTAAKGAGEAEGSFCTPRGRHRVAEKIGARAPLNAVFVARQPTGEIWAPELAKRHPEGDWILTRILWLDGLEEGANRGGSVDTKSRYIYIHGTHAEHLVGTPASHGCIRMKNADVTDLFDRVEVGTAVVIDEG